MAQTLEFFGPIGWILAGASTALAAVGFGFRGVQFFPPHHSATDKAGNVGNADEARGKRVTPIGTGESR